MLKKNLIIAAKLINLHPNTLEYLKKTENALIKSIPITKDKGSVKTFKGYRVYHSNLRG
ncbi:MAG: hypothetical protein KGD63_12820 [Candidatus Lokiarchaeota archaeon]|nr:hypothetical protein [Candidatus Lokiarchaeota archaeon]